MRALLPLLAVAAALRPPALLVLRAACSVPSTSNSDAFDAARFRQFASVQRTTLMPVKLLSYHDTCGVSWRESVARTALSTLGAGGLVECVGWPGTSVCGAMSAAARVLRRPVPAECARVGSRAHAVAELARRLRWSRVLLPPATADSTALTAPECNAALLEVARALSATGATVRYMTAEASDLQRRSHVVILCTSTGSNRSQDTEQSFSGADALLLLLVQGHPTNHQGSGGANNTSATDVAGDKDTKSIPNVTTHSSSGERLDSTMPINGEKHIFKHRTTSPFHELDSLKISSNGTIVTGASVASMDDDHNKKVYQILTTARNQTTKPKSLDNNSHLHVVTGQQQVQEVSLKESASDVIDELDASLDRLGKALPNRVLVLRDAGLGNEHARSVDALHAAALRLLERAAIADRAHLQSLRTMYPLYGRNDLQSAWRLIATLDATSVRQLDEDVDWVTSVEFHDKGDALQRWNATHDGRDGESVFAGLIATLLAAAGAAALASGVALGARLLMARRRRRRRRGDAVLAPADFTFPADERRRVGEGMETMLSCWLKQLHEFGGPELERPDLLKQPAASPRVPSVPSSTCSVNRTIADRRTRYRGDAVHLKCLPAASAFELKRKAIDVLLVMQSLRHENINPFIGCLCDNRPALVFDYCGRGSLEDVLTADDIKLDWTFRLSLLTDLVKGMRYLHASPLRVHGRLSSRSCVVDSRWVLRVSDYGLPAFYRAQALPQPERSARELLWTAPELLRERRGGGGWGATQPGDVFSFAIIMQEVIVRGEPYCMLALTPDEIVEKVSRPPPLIRPSVSMGAAPPEAVSVMRQCWSEAPDLRPDFNRLHDVFRHMHRGRKINIVDSMFEMLEKYSNNLEELIKERTEQLDMEKKKTEQLLNRMLPRSVAERLMLGSRVEPEEFEEVSIYFSDIVGFTALAARSTPVQVVDLLNDLYTTFDAAIEQYRVYKVETIGDAYMVVGGLPKRARDHAESVATMALHLLHLAGRFRVRHLPDTPLHLRIGLHSGPCCAGVVGLTMPRYCLFGDTVNTASRMESTGAAWRIQTSAATAEKLLAAGGYRLRSRGLTQIKGKGAMHTYWLLGKEGFDRPLPTPPPLESEEEILVEAECEVDDQEPVSRTISPSTHSTTPDTAVVMDGCSPESATLPKMCELMGSMSPMSPTSTTALEALPRGPLHGASVDHSAAYARYRWLPGGARSLRRQWSLERGEALAAAAASAEPLALVAGVTPRSAPRYRTRRDQREDETHLT
uniref:Guanylate cyclase n=1 Tax=Manduca sexta TaxID=7130 RepID=Q8IT60_MANSE|nr:receptor guanylyl cyclase GC-II [Manduca sexta]